MAGNLNISTEDAIAEIEQLILRIENLNKSIATMSAKGKSSFIKTAGAVKGLQNNVVKLTNRMNQLNAVVAQNNAVLNAQYNAQMQAQAAAQAQATAYQNLVKEVKEAHLHARNLTAENKASTSVIEGAIQKYQALQAKLDNLNSSVRKTKNEFEMLKDATKRAKDEAQNMIATYGRGSSQATSAVASYDRLKSKLDETSLAVRKLVGPYQALSNATAKAKSEAQDLAVTHGKSNVATQDAIKKYEDLKKKLDAASISTKKLKDETEKASRSGGNMGRMLGRLLGALGFLGLLNMLGKAIQSVVKLTIQFESLGFALNKIAGDNFAEVARTWEFLMELNDKFGAKLSATADRWLKFRAAARQSNMTLVDTMGIFRSVTKAASVLGLSTHELQGVYLALEQMLSKGKVTTEELRRQLGERLPGAMGIMAKAVGVSVEQLDKMLKKGEVLSSYALPKFAKALEEAYGIESLEKVDNLATAVGRMSGAWDRFVLTISEGDSIITKAIGGTMDFITRATNALTNFLETYDQTANRTSGAKFGEKVRNRLNDEIEQRLRLNGVTGKGLKQLEEELKIKEKLWEQAPVDNRVDAVKEVMEAERNLADYRKLMSEEGNLLSIKEYDKAKERLDELKDIVDQKSMVAGVHKNVGSFIDGLITKWSGIEFPSHVTKKDKDELKSLTDEYTEQLELVKQMNELRTLTPITPSDDDDSGRGRKIKLAREWLDTNKLLINSLKEQLRLNEKLAKEEPGGIDDRAEMFERNYQMRQEIAELEREDQIAANKLWLENEEISLQENLGAHADHAVNLAKQEEQNKLQREINERQYLAKIEEIEQEFRLKSKKNIEIDDEEWKSLTTDQFQFQKDLLALELSEHLKVLEDKMKTIRKGGNEEKEILFDLAKIQTDYHNLMIDIDIKRLQRDLENVKTLGEKKRLLEQIAKLESEKKSDPADDYDNATSYDGKGGSFIDPLFAQDFTDESNKAQSHVNDLVNLADAVFEHRIANIQKEIDAETKKYDRLLELAKNDEEETKIIQRNKELALEKLEAKKRKEQIKQAKLQKALNVSQAIQSTAVAVVNALATNPYPLGVALAVSAGLAGALQVAAIMANPIPTFAKGGTMKFDGKAQINDGGRQEYIERDGQILTTAQNNAVVDLKKGDIIHKDYETMQRKSMILNLMGKDRPVSEKDFNLAFGIKEEIREGFEGIKVLSNVTVINETNSYREKMSMWD